MHGEPLASAVSVVSVTRSIPTSEVMDENAGEHVELVACLRLDRHVAHLAVRLELGEDTLLRSPPFYEYC